MTTKDVGDLKTFVEGLDSSYRSFRYKFVQSSCKWFHVLGLKNIHPECFSCSCANYT